MEEGGYLGKMARGQVSRAWNDGVSHTNSRGREFQAFGTS